MRYIWGVIVLMLTVAVHPAVTVTSTRIPSLEKLPVSAVHRIFQDKEGYMWYGTVDGLCWDDGYEVRVFRSDMNTPNLFTNNTIQSIAEDKNGKIWLGTDCGVYQLDKSTCRIVPVDSARLSRLYVPNIWSVNDGSVWLTSYGKLYHYDADGNLLDQFDMTDDYGHSCFVNGLCETRQRKLLVTKGYGPILEWNPATNAFKTFTPSLQGCDFRSIIQDNTKDDCFWVATGNQGIVCVSPYAVSDSIYSISPLPVSEKGKTDPSILYIRQDDVFNHLWATTSSGLVAFFCDYGNRKLKQIQTEVPALSNKMLNEIYKDRNGALWVAAFDAASFIIQLGKNRPQVYSLPAINDRVSFNPAVMALADAGQGCMWLSQERTGMGLYDLTTNRFVIYSDIPELKMLPLGSIKLMTPSRRKGNVWVSPEGTPVVYEFARKGMDIRMVRSYNIGNQISKGESVVSFHEGRNSRLYIGTDKGLYRLNLSDGVLTAMSEKCGRVSSIQEDEDGGIWCATATGVCYLSPADSLTHYPSGFVLSGLAIGEQGTVWVSSLSGVYLFNPAKNAWKDYTALCGLGGNAVNQLVFDVFGHLWIDTNQALIEYNPRNNASLTYSTGDEAVQMHRFIPTAICSGFDGKIYFGGIPGIFSVTPSDRLDGNHSSVNTVLTDIRLGGRSILFDLHQPLGDKLELKHSDRDLEICFSSLDFLNAHKLRYAYRLVGMDDDWDYTPVGNNSVMYKHLPSGNYRFEVKSMDQYGVWSDKITTLDIVCLPPFYLTWWAYTFYILFIVGLVYAAFRFYLKKEKRRNDELYADSTELMKMRNYLQQDSRDMNQSGDAVISCKEYEQLDELLKSKVLQVVEEHLSEPDFDVNKLAAEMGMSRSTLTRKLKSMTGMTPLEYIRKIKMQHACKLLQDPNRNVSEIALMLGYSDRKYFTSCFKDDFGVTPSEYQKRYRQGEV